MKKRLVAGIDIGGTKCAYGLVDEDGQILCRGQVPTASCESPAELAKIITKEILKLSHALNGAELIGAGIGAPNGNYLTGSVEYAPNLKWKGIIPLASYFKEAMNCDSLLTNDAKAAAYGEMIFGGAKLMKDFLFITLGTGLGSGIVANGEMIYGFDGMAGEVGHTIIIPGGRQCGCGRKGCLETYCSATGLSRTYAELQGKSQEERIPAKEIFELARAEESFALEAFATTGAWLGFALANSVAYTRPEAIFLFGGLAQAKELLFMPVIESFEKNLLEVYKGKIKILPSRLPGGDAAILGAASLVWKNHTSAA